MPYFAPSGAILRIYSIGSLNSSAVGLNVGASGMLCSLFLLLSSGAAVFWPLRSTVDRSKGAERRALNGIGTLLWATGGTEFVPWAGILPFDDGTLVAGVFDAGRVVAEAVAVAPPLLGGTTMTEAALVRLHYRTSTVADRNNDEVRSSWVCMAASEGCWVVGYRACKSKCNRVSGLISVILACANPEKWETDVQRQQLLERRSDVSQIK